MNTNPECIGNQLNYLTDKELQRVLLQYQKRAGFSSTKEMLSHLKEVVLCRHFDYLGQMDEIDVKIQENPFPLENCQEYYDEFEKMALEMGGKVIKLAPDNKETVNIFKLSKSTEKKENPMRDLYLIKSINRTKLRRKDTYWTTNECEYTHTIANAGFYEEDQAKEIVARFNGNTEMIPVTKELLQEATRQLDKRVEDLISAKEYEQRRYERTLEDLTKKSDEVSAGYTLLDEIADKMDITIKEDEEDEKGM